MINAEHFEHVIKLTDEQIKEMFSHTELILMGLKLINLCLSRCEYQMFDFGVRLYRLGLEPYIDDTAPPE